MQIPSRSLLLGCFPFLATVAAAQAPPGYYDAVDTSSAAALRTTLNDVIDDHLLYPYTSNATDTWDILESSSEDPSDSNRILDVYGNTSFSKQGGGNSFYNREHVWPNSYGYPDDDGENYPFTDCHCLFLCFDDYNTERSNKPFDTCDASCDEWTTVFNDGQGGGSGVYPGNSNWTEGQFEDGTWEVWSGRRGDIARAILYMDVRYEGGVHGQTGFSEPDLIVTDDRFLIASGNTGDNESVAYMGILSTLLEWHVEDPVDSWELDRMEGIFVFQGNRNPFVDHPEWVDILWGGGAVEGPLPTVPWINEIHYDNSGSDLDEGVEIAGVHDLDLTGWSVAAYDGSSGSLYQTLALSGVIQSQQDCIGTLNFALPGLQDGAPDGLALVDPTNVVVEFLSYEGSFTATDGPAAGMASTDIGVSENASPVGQSLQLTGIGSQVQNFAWVAPQTSTFGSPNTGQIFDTECGTSDVYGCGSNPAGSMSVLGGTANLGSTLSLGIDNPVGSQSGGSFSVVYISQAPDPSFPCGSILPNFGMNGPGELLISLQPGDLLQPARLGSQWLFPGLPALVTIPIPVSNSLIGLDLYMQGGLFDPSPGASPKIGVTDAVSVLLGP